MLKGVRGKDKLESSWRKYLRFVILGNLKIGVFSIREIREKFIIILEKVRE